MISVTWEKDPEFERWHCAVDGEPALNCTERSPEQMRALIVAVYNAGHGTSLSESDFTFTEGEPVFPDPAP